MLSDDASTYVVAAEYLQKLLQSDQIKETLGHQNIAWKFTLKCASWYSRVWAHLIELTKQAVKKTLGRAFITSP